MTCAPLEVWTLPTDMLTFLALARLLVACAVTSKRTVSCLCVLSVAGVYLASLYRAA